MLIDDLKAIQQRHGFLPEEELQALAQRLRLPLHQIHGVVSFYPHFRLLPAPRLEVKVCTDLPCHLRGADRWLQEIEAILAPLHLDGQSLGACSCLGRCDRMPAITINGQPYSGLSVPKLRETIQSLLLGRRPRRPRRLSPAAPLQINPYPAGESPYQALGQLLSQLQAAGSDEDKVSGVKTTCLEVIKASGLRGMGGAGFPTGVKWELVHHTPATEKYVICNADESEPGTFKDRYLLQVVPHLVLEGMLIAALCVGASRGYIYIRHEYGEEHQLLQQALRRCHRLGLLREVGLRAAADSRGFPIELFESPGGYICGEETALLEALEGRRAEPRNRPPFPGTVGLFGRPTLINNVETFALIPAILLRGGEWFKGLGRQGGMGLKLLALSGHVRRPGVYEVPMGIPARELIFGHGGGLLRRGRLKAFAPGGASSGFLPASQVDLPLDFQPLAQAGSMLGAGAVVAVAEPTCMLDVALNVGRFFRQESCGKCVPCRVGTDKLVSSLERISRGEGSREELEGIGELAETMQQTSICGLGQAAPLPITSVLKYFGDEVMDHLSRRRCPSGICFARPPSSNGLPSLKPPHL